MKAAICEDEPAQAAETARLLQEWAARHGEPAALSVFPSAEALRFRWEEEQDWDLLVLDIQMPGENGMDLARALRAGGFRGAILFLTAVPDFMAQGYDVEALHYLLKPVEPEKLFACLDRACRRAGRAYTLLVSDPKGAAVRIDQKEIRFLRVRAHEVEVSASGLYFFSGSLDAAEKELGLRRVCALPPLLYCGAALCPDARARPRCVGGRHVPAGQPPAIPVRACGVRRLLSEWGGAFVKPWAVVLLILAAAAGVCFWCLPCAAPSPTLSTGAFRAIKTTFCKSRPPKSRICTARRAAGAMTCKTTSRRCRRT